MSLGVMDKVKASFRRWEMMGHRSQRINQLAQFGDSQDQVRGYVREIENDQEFLNGLKDKLSDHTDFSPGKYDLEFSMHGGSPFFPGVTLYVLMRLLKPQLVVETGGTPGKSSAFILQAMKKNGQGFLYTLDLAPKKSNAPVMSENQHEKLPEGLSAGWIVPEDLRKNHELVLGESQQTMPELFKRIPAVDIFIHDSDHSYQNMMWEFERGYQKIKSGGLLLSDDITDNTSWPDFVGKHKDEKTFVIANFGFLIKK